MIDPTIQYETPPLPAPDFYEDVEVSVEGAESSAEPTVIENEDGSVEVILDAEGAADDDLKAAPFDANLAELLSEDVLTDLANEIIELVDADERSRREWKETYIKGLEVLGVAYEERTEPWAGACGVFSPLLNEAAIRFQSEIITEAFPAAGPVKTQIIGEETPENKAAAERVKDDMNYRLTEQMVEYRPEHERMLYSLGLAGAAFKKVYTDPNLGRPTAPFVPAEDIIMPYGASSVYTSERVTMVMRKTKNELTRLQVAGFYRNVDLGDPVATQDEVEEKKAEQEGVSLIDDDRYRLYETHAYLEVPGLEEDYPVPYIITLDSGTNKVLGLRRNWREDDPHKIKQQHFVQYTYVPGFGAYGMGFIHIIGGYARGGTSLIRQLVDAGTLSNLPGGLKTKGLRIKGDDTPVAPGEWRDVDVAAGTLRENLMPMPYKEPSQTLLALLDKLTEEGRRLGSIADLKVADMSSQAPVGTTLALLERQLKMMGAVQARVHASQREEFKLLKALIKESPDQAYTYTPVGGKKAAMREDYDRADVLPVSDPNAATMSQRIMQYQAAYQMSQGAPQVYNMPYLHRQMLEVLGIKNADKIVPIEEDAKPRDPISENMAFLTGKPTQAFIHQDHQAHIAVHMALMQDPSVMQLIGQSPMAQQMMGAVMAHVAQHMAFAYRAQVEEQLGVPLTPPDADLDPQVEVQLSRLVAQAAQQLLQSNVQKAQQQQAQQVAADPMLQLKERDVAVKEGKLQLDAKKTAADIAAEQERLRIDKMRVASDINRSDNQVRSAERQADKRIKADIVKTVHAKKAAK